MTVAEVLALFERHGGAHHGEDVPQLDHALQSAWLATGEGATDALVVAALLHDVGHLLAADGATGARSPHEATGAAWLAGWLPEEVAGPVRLHVAAKRFLCRRPADRAALSDASRASLAVQGGPFTDDEAERFVALRHAGDAVRLRGWDDRAKVPERVVPPLAAYEDLLRRVAA